MITAVDTNILIDILEPDPSYGSASKEALKRCLLEGVVVACEVVWKVFFDRGKFFQRCIRRMEGLIKERDIHKRRQGVWEVPEDVVSP